jgi:hypothetical protein
MIASLWSNGALQLSTEQQLFFINLDWSVDTSGKIKSTEKKLPSKTSLKALFVQLGYVVPGYRADFNNGWDELITFYDVRDALIHPKTIEGLKPEKATLLRIEKGREWLQIQLRQVNDALLAVLPPRG